MSESHKKALQAVIFDWAGTTVDYGCFAPVAVFIKLFQQRRITITIAQARAPMGLEKRDHIRSIAGQPEVAAQWEKVYRKPCSEAEIDAMYRDSLVLQKNSVLEYANLIPGTLEAVAYCRERGLKIGSTTGYSRAVMEALRLVAAARGYEPDALVCPDDVAGGRPAPYMIYSNAIHLQVYPMSAIVKVGDTLPDIAEGLNAGCWTVGLSQTGNELGLTQAEALALPEADLAARLTPIEQRMRDAGAHEVIRSIADLPNVITAIENRMLAGEQP